MGIEMTSRKQRVLGIGMALVGMTLWAEPSGEVVDGQYVFTVPAGEEHELTADDVAAIGENDFVLSGGGTLKVGDVMKDFTGNIYVTNGVYSAITTNAFGTAAGATYALDHGTLESTIKAPNTWTSGGGYPSWGTTETFYVEGTGYGDLGVVHGKTATDNLCRKMELTGDALFVLEDSLDIRYASPFNMNRHKLTVNCKKGWFYFVSMTLRNVGDIEILKGGISYQDGIGDGGNATNVVTIGNGGAVSMWNSSPALNYSLVFEGNGSFYSSNSGKFALGSAGTPNLWAGPVTLGGMVKNDIENSVTPRGITISGKISGSGGFYGGRGGWIQLANGENDFTGGASAVGATTGQGDADVRGGFSILADGAIPQDGGPLALTNAVLRTQVQPQFPTRALHTPAKATYPDLVAHGRVVVSNTREVVGCTFKSLTKTGTGTLSFFGRSTILGTADIQGGTVRFATERPQVQSGLYWYHNNGGSNLEATKPSGECWGIDSTGVGYAYKTWPEYHTGKLKADGTLANEWKNLFYYAGYINIPGEEGADVVCNFASSICRDVRVDIGGQTVVKMNDTTDKLTGKKLDGWTRMYVGPAVTLKAGWQPIYVYMYNSWDNTKGPVANNNLGWASNFGIGIDWQARSVTNYQNYVRLLDPGDGSFLRPEIDPSKFDPSIYRPAFEGAVAFASGTVLDINDVQPHTPVVFPSLTGLPTIKNGDVTVTDGTWTVRKADVEGGTPLTVMDGVTFQFAPNTKLVVTDVDDIDRAQKVRPLIRVAEGGTLVNPPTYTHPQGSKWRAEWSEDGNALDLVYRDGLTMIVR